ncbi:hypothetical protein F4677DRAFT_447137 [Hypoxylon crocopeplum]|nr:hypothetical protein F4677DRAFT_447137 [Hypoxylon crocopeplum]
MSAISAVEALKQVFQLSSYICAYMNTTVKADAPTLKVATEAFNLSVDLVKGFRRILFALDLEPYPVFLLEKCISAGGDVTGLTSATSPLVSALVRMTWSNKDDDNKILACLNYAYEFQDPIGSYGTENKTLLQGVSKKYDPEGIFQKGCPGGFKLFT